MAWTTATTRATDFFINAAIWNSEVVDNMNFLKRPGYAEFTADVSITGISYVDIVSLGTITYEAVPHKFEFWCSRLAVGSSSTMTLALRDAANDLGILIQPAASSISHAIYWSKEITPTAASHTYKISGANASAQTSTVNAGAGGAGVRLPGWIRVRRVPT